MLAHRLPRGRLERLAEQDRLFDEAVLDGVTEDAAHAGHFVAEAMQSPALGDRGPIALKVAWAEVGHGTMASAALDEHLAGRSVQMQRVRRQFAVVHQIVFHGQESTAQTVDGEFLFVADNPAGVQIVLLIEVAYQGAVGIVPAAKVDELSADLFAPAPGRVWR